MAKKKRKANAEESSPGRKKGRKYYEFFEIIKKGRKKTVKVEGFEEESVEKVTKKQIKQENKILRHLFIIIGTIVIGIILTSFIFNSVNNFEYKGVKFQKVDEVAPYKTQFPVIYNGNIVPYNIYLRNDPRKLDKIEFDGKINIFNEMVINATSDFNCNGDGIIAVANLVQFYEILGTNIFKNETLSCDDKNRYTFIQIQEGNETKIEQFGYSCYNININNCEILEGTERFMIESFVEVNKMIRGEN